MGLYAAAVVAANAAQVPAGEVNKLALIYVASRVAYNFAYVVLQENSRLAPLRTIAWGTGIAMIAQLFLKASSQLNA
jgi:uncharacterized MAPEG superfamily protein